MAFLCQRQFGVAPLRRSAVAVSPCKGQLRAAHVCRAVPQPSVSIDNKPATLPDFDGHTYKRGEDATYDEYATQYASLNHETDGTMKPAAIIRAAGDEDVKKALTWARQNNVAVAVRTGGHQYSGASSTGGPNIQLDLGTTYEDITWLDDNTVEVGISRKLSRLNEELRERDAFVPHGQCAHVHVGGHVHSGGYGLIGRAFGLFGDHIAAIRVITADGRDGTCSGPRWIERGTTDPKEAQLFWAVLGGSPGNFAVVTHIRLKPHKGSDHPKARGLRLFSLYNPKTLENLLKLKAEMVHDKELPADFDFCITVQSGRGAVRDLGTEPDKHSDDDHHDKRSPLEMYGVTKDEFDLEEHLNTLEAVLVTGEPVTRFQHLLSQFIDHSGIKDDSPQATLVQDALSFRPMIVVFTEWANLGGASQSEAAALAWFDRIRACGTWLPTPGHKGWGPDSTPPRSISYMTSKWVFPLRREFDMPYEKRTFVTNATNLDTSGWVDFTLRQMNNMVLNHMNGCRLGVQIQHFGGNNSKFRTKANDHTSYSFRDSTLVLILDAFYRNEKAHEIAKAWQAKNDKFYKGPEGNFSPNMDRRVFWGSYEADGTDEINMCKHWPKYHENQEKWDKLCDIKARVDPDNVLSPNPFSVRVPAWE